MLLTNDTETVGYLCAKDWAWNLMDITSEDVIVYKWYFSLLSLIPVIGHEYRLLWRLLFVILPSYCDDSFIQQRDWSYSDEQDKHDPYPDRSLKIVSGGDTVNESSQH